MRAGGGSLSANCGYGKGFSVLEVLDAVRAVHGADFPVTMTDRRPGDPAMIVANPALAKRELGCSRAMTT